MVQHATRCQRIVASPEAVFAGLEESAGGYMGLDTAYVGFCSEAVTSAAYCSLVWHDLPGPLHPSWLYYACRGLADPVLYLSHRAERLDREGCC